MPDNSLILGLPYILPAQAQKHVTHNEALRILDALTQLSVVAIDIAAPPAGPVQGVRYVVPTAATGDWAGHAGEIAMFDQSAWVFFTPLEGWIAYVQADSQLVAFDGTDWAPFPLDLGGDDLQNLDWLGINTTADLTNRLAVAADATLLTHDGTDHRVKVNKASDTDTASLLFQSDYSGRAEMGLAGNDNFSVKVSSDGSSFNDAMVADAATGEVNFPAGLNFGNDTLAHYEEGSFVPSLSFGGDSTGITYNHLTGYFIRIGNLVFIHISVVLATMGTGTSNAEVSDLPYDTHPAYYPGEVFFIKGGVNLSAPKCRVAPGNKVLLLNSTPTGTTALKHTNFTFESSMKISLLHML